MFYILSRFGTDENEEKYKYNHKYIICNAFTSHKNVNAFN